MLLIGADLVTMDPGRTTIRCGGIAIKSGRIADIGSQQEILEKYQAIDPEVIDVSGKVILPGFVNAHTHAIHILLRGGLSQDRVLYDWLLNILNPGVNAYTEDDARIAASLYCKEAFLSGITTIVDNADFGKRQDIAEATIDTYKRCGMRAIYARMFADYSPPELDHFVAIQERKLPSARHPMDYFEETEVALSSIEDLIKRHHRSEGGRIQVWPSPGIALYSTEKGLLGAYELAEKFDCMITTHVAESIYDEYQHNMRSVEFLDAVGYLGSRLLIGHGVHLNDSDLRKLKVADVKVAHNCVSNQFLASGIAPIQRMNLMGITVGIGTDDANCNTSVNMVSDMKHVALLQKVANRDAAAITAEKVLEMATIEGARAIGLEAEIGSLEVGKRADLIVVGLDYPHMIPHHHFPGTLVYQGYGTEIEMTMVDGKIVMRNRETPELDARFDNRLHQLAQEASVAVLDRAGLKKVAQRQWHSFVS